MVTPGQKLSRVYVGVPAKQTDVNVALVAQGRAWHDKRYSDDEYLAEAETAARRERKGVAVRSVARRVVGLVEGVASFTGRREGSRCFATAS